MVEGISKSKDRPSDPRNQEVVQPAAGDPQIGNLATPINASGLSKWWINIQPAYRQGITPYRRGLEVGIAQGLWVIIPFVKLGPLRDTDTANIAGFLSAIGLLTFSTAAIVLYAASNPRKPVATITNPQPPVELTTSAGWYKYANGFFVGGIIGTTITFFVLSNWAVIQNLFG